MISAGIIGRPEKLLPDDKEAVKSAPCSVYWYEI
jgi:hypothetical protein